MITLVLHLKKRPKADNEYEIAMAESTVTKADLDRIVQKKVYQRAAATATASLVTAIVWVKKIAQKQKYCCC
ncbi:hypothetical protein F441_14643 [Phytophthora nicotianae CJ01A1]|uniref:Uncharacterized protein n=4 Tax=Phytophthora nicotianae TaxID=4792 RepID=W2YR82_PHYNI|nr:hypothetical protein L915_14377 [Phytophthora nicotianae]ETL33202.1 hypothetical protein L916_14286 [Phytophthora nicotianae]ETO68329.1 hypothetical protein F444_14814 [Phytophthora nicotianae P1976]ETP09490.1 hypothetical protein F441_14643 [Phytophthora nicotianae CJ01A1]ETP37540.1 hypothetical protein F442_14641 [Phytophthora nicotianae P10297]